MSVNEMLVKYRDARKSLDTKFENKEITADIYSYLVLFMNKVIDDLSSINEKSMEFNQVYSHQSPSQSYNPYSSTKSNKEIEAMDEGMIGYWTSSGVTKI